MRLLELRPLERIPRLVELSLRRLNGKKSGGKALVFPLPPQQPRLSKRARPFYNVKPVTDVRSEQRLYYRVVSHPKFVW
jgi:hypothetical protein